ncbi:unnamed protein product [Orchesella dallaii]|uniref:Uncharacterized protein n=1 Tax=Orchesella dallaii TaxID=48710 RepID=A0ABP1Q9V5_9HEXA
MMASGSSMILSLLMGVVFLCNSVAFADSPVSASSDSSSKNSYSSYQYAVEPSSDYGAPQKGYAPAPTTVYGPPPAPSYGPPTYDGHGYSLDSESPFVQQRLFNTAVALTIPLFSFTLPQRSSNYGGIDLANQVIFGAFVLVATLFVFVVPIFFTKPSEARSNDKNGILNSLMANNKVFNFMNADLSNKIGLDTSKCLQKSICEANRSPKKYGVMATPFQMFFPPPSNGTADARATIFQLAAKDGKYSKKECGKLYNCFFDIMDMASYMVDWWKYSGDPNYFLHF